MLKRIFKRSENSAAKALYGSAVRQARSPVFYRDLCVPDTVDGRFDMIIIHVLLILRRLRTNPAETKGEGRHADRLAQALFDTMFADMDTNLRELGVGDLAVPKRIKKMAEAFYGRVSAYDAALDNNDNAALESAIARNVYGGQRPDAAAVAAIAHYVAAADHALASTEISDLSSGHVSFPPPPGTPQD